jgi:hypothetical protein
MVLSASPTLTGTLTAAAITASGDLTLSGANGKVSAGTTTTAGYFANSTSTAFYATYGATHATLANQLEQRGDTQTFKTVGGTTIATMSSALLAVTGAATVSTTITASADRAYRGQGSGNLWLWGVDGSGTNWKLTENGVADVIVIATGGLINLPVAPLMGAGAWPTSTIGRSGSRMGNFSATESSYLLMGDMQAGVGVDRGGQLWLGARGTTATADFAYASVIGARESAVSGTLSTYLSFKTSNAAGTLAEGLRISSAGAVTIPGGSLTVTPANTATYAAATAATPKLISTSTSSGLNTYGGIQMGNGGSAGANILVVEQATTYGDMVFQVYNGTYREALRLAGTGAVTIPGTLGVTGTITASDTFINAVNTTALFGVLTSANGSKFVIQSNMSGNNAPEIINTHADSTGDYALKFYRNTSSLVGSIQTTNVATSYVTSSDYRLKENIKPMKNALATVAALKPVMFNWKVDGSDGQGFIAHELQTVVPDCVTGQKDATEMRSYEISAAVPATFDEEGNELTVAVEAVMGEREVPKYQGVDTSFLVATLTAAIQELTARITALESK